LEVKLAAINEKKAGLQAQLQQERRTINRLRSTLSETERKEHKSEGQLNYLETVLNKYEQRNYDLEEREVELRHRLEMLENCMPALVMWNVWRLLQNTGISRVKVTDEFSSALVKVSNGNCYGIAERSGQNTSLQLSVRRFPAYCDLTQSSMLRDVEQESQRSLVECPEADKTYETTEECVRPMLHLPETEAGLMNAEIQRYREYEDTYMKIISELQNEIYLLKNGSKVTGCKATDVTPETKAETEVSDRQFVDVTSVRCGKLECERRLRELLQNEDDMKKRISELEMKESAYKEALQRADELWLDKESSYKALICQAENNEAVLKERVRKMEESKTKLRLALQQYEDSEMLLEKVQDLKKSDKMLAEKNRILRTEKNELIEEVNHLRDSLQSVQDELEKTKEMDVVPLKKELQVERKMIKTLENEIIQLQKESNDHQVQVSVHGGTPTELPQNKINSSSLARQPFVSPSLPQNYSPFFPIVGPSGYSFFKFLNNLIFTV
jgi:hypothetical protein